MTHDPPALTAPGRAAPPGGPWLFPTVPAVPAVPAAPTAPATGRGPEAVLFDRDGTLIEDVPYNADPALVRPMPQARAALDLLRGHGVALGVVSNQSGVARGRYGRGGVAAVRERVEHLLGGFDVWAVCPHGPGDGCGCRKPAPGLVHAACRRLGVAPARCAVVGDIGSDLAAAHAAGARGVLVPTSATRPQEVTVAGERADDLLAAAHILLSSAGRAG